MTDKDFEACELAKPPANQRLQKLMHRHGNPKHDFGETRRAMQPWKLRWAALGDLVSTEGPGLKLRLCKTFR